MEFFATLEIITSAIDSPEIVPCGSVPMIMALCWLEFQALFQGVLGRGIFSLAH